MALNANLLRMLEDIIRNPGQNGAERSTRFAQDDATAAANLGIAASRRKRRLASLFAGGRSVLGAYAGRGAPGGAGTPNTSSGAGSALGSQAGRSYGGQTSFGGLNRLA